MRLLCSSFFYVLLFCTCVAAEMKAVTPVDSTDRASIDSVRAAGEEPHRFLRLEMIAGLNRRLTEGVGSDTALDYATGGLTGIARLTLVPEHLLRIGVESGYMRLTAINEVPSEKQTPDRLVLTAIPMFLTLAMGGESFEFGGGIGAYQLVVSAGNTDRTNFASVGTELGFMINGSWHYRLSRRLEIGADLRVYDIAERPITIAILGLSLRTSLFDL